MAQVGTDFPQLCETCLGPNPYVRMIKLPPGHKLCTISGLSYQAFRWTPSGGRQKETIISYAVAKERNICQTCLNDMQYGLPVGVRDKILTELGKGVSKAPESIDGSRYHYSQLTNAAGSDSADVEASSALTLTDNDLLQTETGQHLIRLAQAKAAQEAKAGVSFRNLPKLCSFWVLGTCTRCVRGVCQFRPCCGPTSYAFPEIARSEPEMCSELVALLKEKGPVEIMNSLSDDMRKALQASRRGIDVNTAIRERVSGNDDLTEAYLGRMDRPATGSGAKQNSRPLNPPEDVSICTLWLGSIEEKIDEKELSKALQPGGAFADLYIARKAKCAFVEYPSRVAAEHAASTLHRNLQIQGQAIAVKWAKPNPAPKKRSATRDEGSGRAVKKVKL